MKTRFLLLGLLAGALLTGGCATTSAMKTELDTCKTSLAGCEADLAKAAKAQADLTRRLSAAEASAAAIERRMAAYRDLAAKLRAAFGGDDRAQNRRTEIIVMPLLDEIPELPGEL
jgi:septal ring factor EnvC (AmiA/AmiB activator)